MCSSDLSLYSALQAHAMFASMWRMHLLLFSALLIHSFPCPSVVAAEASPLSNGKEDDGAGLAPLLPEPLVEEMLIGAEREPYGYGYGFGSRRPYCECELGVGGVSAGGFGPPRFMKRNFNPWGGKRAGAAESVPRLLEYFKRGTFNAWGGKRQEGGRSTKSDGSGTRNLPFNPWGGR